MTKNGPSSKTRSFTVGVLFIATTISLFLHIDLPNTGAEPQDKLTQIEHWLPPRDGEEWTKHDVAGFIFQFEGFESDLYLDNRPIGHLTIGVGHLVEKEPMTIYQYLAIRPGGKYAKWEEMTDDELIDLYYSDLEYAYKIIDRYVDVRLASNERAALVSLAYNWGYLTTAKFEGGETLIDMINRHAPINLIENAWMYPVTAGSSEVLPGLVKRRKAELTLFMSTWRNR